MEQQALDFKQRGGRRAGAGRPKKGDAGMPHQARERVTRHTPVHVTWKMAADIPDLRTEVRQSLLEQAFAEGCDRFGFRLVHYSIQRDHLHLVVEADDNAALGRGVQGLGILIAKRLNRHLGRRGAVMTDRFHARVLHAPKPTRHALNYVLNNSAHHLVERGIKPPEMIDPLSSGPWFDGWMRPGLWAPSRTALPPRPTAEARSWVLRIGWRQHGLLIPGDATPRRHVRRIPPASR